MADHDGHVVEKEPTPATTASGGDVENQGQPGGGGAGISNILRRWKREDLLKKGSLALRGIALVCSLLAFIIMASNKHGDGRNFDDYEPYRYVLAIAILSTLYTGLQVFRQVHELSSAAQYFSRQNLAMVDFIGDQVGGLSLKKKN
ncbi:OLC1v1033584C2 [Oldenlandia corymbosa var. corymbosa]|uniref:CASP-like protein n=1 Tax=Oldenlandia corymbosa var. corymbosa TaxID=529605 RepID=A0AAV1CNL9_OLDCO|nr:OLC1v1033584C2 [Oldenlandia corymbosa var. corymbosa]